MELSPIKTQPVPELQPTPPTPIPSLEVISAGAGSGKTYTLTHRMLALLKSGVRPSGIMATTFTKKAAAELQERVRLSLLQEGMPEAANELGEALIGTVHSIGTKLLQRFAFEAGVSPQVEIIADGDEQRLFNESLSQVLTVQRIETMNLLADRLGLTKKSTGETYDWRRDIRELTNVARANNFDREVLQTSKTKSWEQFSQLLPPVQTNTPEAWTTQLNSALTQAIDALNANEADTTKTTRDAVETLRQLSNQLNYRGELYWYEWVKIAKTNPGAKSKEIMDALRAFAFSHAAHPRFQEDIKTYIGLVFDIASDALNEYKRYKQKRGLIDYTDMETYVGSLLRVETVRETLRQELDLLLVDEFQDTSPIQLDIFLQISGLARHSIWVGDPKQSIYGFRGAEPALMHAIIKASGGIREDNILKKSWRSRPDLVHAVNAIFEKAFEDLPASQIVLEPAFKEPVYSGAEPAPGPALVHWHFRSDLDERRPPGGPWLDHCIADQIRILLDQKPLIYSKKRDKLQVVKPGDIAVLCRSNRQCLSIAEALHKAGLKAAIARTGLLETPEIKLALASLKFLLTPSDTLAAAELLFLTGAMDLEAIVAHRLKYLSENPEQFNPFSSWGEAPLLVQLLQLRPRTADLAASEILNLVLEELDLRRSVAALGNMDQRLDNLDKLRKYALDYESACQRLHSAATLGGFLLWLNSLANQDQDQQGSGETEDAVRVLTYHRSKGLEFPITICHSLDQGLKEQIWGLNLISELEDPDLNNLLGNRWLRFWINPYADQIKNTPLEEAVLQTEAFLNARKTALQEEARLLYVGLTRARDYMVFPTTAKGTSWLNRVFNQGDDTIPTLDPHSDETPFYKNGMPLIADTSILYKPKDFPASTFLHSPVLFHPKRLGKQTLPVPKLWIDPVIESPPGFQITFDEPLNWGSWLPFQGEYQPAIGKAIKSIFIADEPDLDLKIRNELAQKQLLIRAVSSHLNPAQTLEQSSAFQSFLQKQFSATAWQRKYQVEFNIQNRRLLLDADLFSENEGKSAIMLFAPFAEGMKKWRQHAQHLGAILAWWHYLHHQGTLHFKTLQTWVVFPLEGQAVRVNCKNEKAGQTV